MLENASPLLLPLETFPRVIPGDAGDVPLQISSAFCIRYSPDLHFSKQGVFIQGRTQEGSPTSPATPAIRLAGDIQGLSRGCREGPPRPDLALSRQVPAMARDGFGPPVLTYSTARGPKGPPVPLSAPPTEAVSRPRAVHGEPPRSFCPLPLDNYRRR